MNATSHAASSGPAPQAQVIPAPEAQIIHESETQRQYARLSLPSRALLDGAACEVRDLSSGGVSLGKVAGDFAAGQQIWLELNLPFEGFSLNLPLEAEVRHRNAAKKTLGCRFVSLSREQVSFLNHVIKSFIAGDIVSPGGILNIAARNSHVKPRAPANRNAAPGMRRQLPGLLLIAAIGLLIAAFIGGNLYNSIFVVKADDAAVVGPVIAVRAPQDGVFRARLDPAARVVQQNEVIGTFTPQGGGTLTLQSPCTCYVARTSVSNVELAAQGQELLSLMPIAARPWVTASIEPAQAKKIGPDSTATVSVFGAKTQYTGHVAGMESALSGARAAGDHTTLLKIVLDQKMPVDFVNRAASVTFGAY